MSSNGADRAALREEFERLRQRVDALESQRNDAIDALAASTGLSRRHVLGIIGGGAGIGALGALTAGEARGAASTSDSDGDIGTSSSRADLFTDGINYAMATPSTATTVSEPIIAYDCSVSGFTITLDSALEPANGTQVVMLIDQTGNAGTKAMTVTATSNIDGGANITINHDNAVTILIYDGSEWRSTRFIDTVDTGELSVTNETLIKAVGSSEVSSITAGTFTSPDWGTPSVDQRSEFSGNAFTPDNTGWYWWAAAARDKGGSDGDLLSARIRNTTDGTTVQIIPDQARIGASNFLAFPKAAVLVNLTSAKNYEFQVTNSDSQFTIDDGESYLSIMKAF